MASVTSIPREALEWLSGTERASILLIGASEGYATTLARMGHSVTVVDENHTVLSRLAIWHQGIHVVAAKAESLPFDPSYFQVVLAIQNLHTFAPGLALAEWARVLRPEGWVGLAYRSRDDSVPWVKKLKRIVQSHCPEAMTSEYAGQSASALEASAYFPRVETTSYRAWIPSTRAELQESARHAPGADELDEDELATMLDEIGGLYDDYARVPDPLLLPYKIECWRAKVDQSTLTTLLIPGDNGLSISL